MFEARVIGLYKLARLLHTYLATQQSALTYIIYTNNWAYLRPFRFDRHLGQVRMG